MVANLEAIDHVRKLCLGGCLLSMLGYPGIATSGGDVVGYIYEAEGEVSGKMKTRYSRGDEIHKGDTITVGTGPSSRMVVFHNYKCGKIEFSGITVTFNRAFYLPKQSPKIKVLKSGCKTSFRLVGEKAGMVWRSGSSDRRVENASTKPDFLLEGNPAAYDRIELQEVDNPANTVVLNIGAETRLIEWPSNVGSLKPETAYLVRIGGNSTTGSLDKTIKTVAETGAKDSAILIVIKLGNGK
tara:strand:- start:106 stop:828 length:723 start_codon:yes stop_codon:yes gene_type:complete